MKFSIFITGSTDGIGKLAAIQLAQAGHQVFLHGRSKAKLDDAVTEVKALTKNNDVKGYLADLSNFGDIRQLTDKIKKDLPHLDVLINNAGVYNSPVNTNSDGLDLRFMVNYLAPVMLTRELLPLLKKGTSARIINLSSAAQSPVSPEALQGTMKIAANTSYAQSKLALTMWSFDLANKLSDIAVMALNPGSLLNTRMVKEAYGHHWSPAEKGAEIIVQLATTDTPATYHGKYYDNDQGRLNQAHADAYNASKIKALLEVTEEILVNSEGNL